MSRSTSIWLLTLFGLGSCSLFGSTREEPISPDEQYLPTGGNAIDAGPDQSNLVQALEEEQIRIRNLKEEIGRLTGETERLSAELKTAKASLAQTSEARSRSAHEATELEVQVRQLKTKILMLQIENTQLEQAKVLMRLAALRTHQDAMTATKANAMPMSGANR